MALERLTELPDGAFAYRLRHAWTDGTEVLVFEPVTLIEKLVALVPRPNAHLVWYHGVLTPRVKAMLEARGLPWEPPARSPARPPPQSGFDFPET